ncbi:MAG: TRAP transporter small permease [Qingshengfaniella sp.]
MKRLFGLVDACVAGAVAVLFAVALILSLVGVAGRYVSARIALDWVGEVVIYLVIWAVLLGAARVVRRAAHIRVDFLAERLAPRAARLAEALSLVLAFGLSLFLVWSGWKVVAEAIMWGERSVSTLRVPLWIYYAALPVSFALQLLFLIERAFDLVTGRPAFSAIDLTD